MEQYYLTDTYEQRKVTDVYFFFILAIGFLLGVLFYDTTVLFSSIDEITAFLLLFIYGAKCINKEVSLSKPLLVTGAIFMLYLAYSLAIHSNQAKAIAMDFVIQLKPYIAFFTVLALKPRLGRQARLFLQLICWVSFGYLLIVGALGEEGIYRYMGHVSRYATACTALFMLYLSVSTFSFKNIAIASLFLTLGLLSTRSKFYGFYLVSVLLSIAFKRGFRLKFNLKTILLAVVVIAGAAYVAWDKISYYFITGAFESEETFARPLLYLTSVEILRDYFPLGSGFASFATYASGAYYSPIYSLYNLDTMWGLTPENPMFVADSYYPALAQFGVVGILLFVGFFLYIIQCSRKNKLLEKNQRLLIVLGVIFFAVESIADATFTHNRGLFILMLMAFNLTPKEDQESVSVDNDILKKE